MKTLKIVIEKSSDSFGAYAQDVNGIYGAGDTLAEVKQSINDAIDNIKTFDEKDIPEILKEDIELKHKVFWNIMTVYLPAQL